MSYQSTWTRAYSLDEFNVKSHDGAMSPKELKQRAKSYCDVLFPEDFFKAGDSVLDFGCGVGYILEELLRRFPFQKIVGLDISRPTLQLAAQRFSHPALIWQPYDGKAIPFEDQTFDKVYSTACIQHIEEHAALLLLTEMMRVLKPGGKAVLHFITWKSATLRPAADLKKEYEAIVNGEECHWHIYYTREELEIKFSWLLGASEVEFKNLDPAGSDVILYATKGDSGGPGRTSAAPDRKASKPLSWGRVPGRIFHILWFEGPASFAKHLKDRTIRKKR